MQVVIDPPRNAEDKAALQAMKDARTIDQFAQHVKDNFVLERALTLHFGGEDGPHYDPEASTIHMPYGFIQEVDDNFSKARYQRPGVSRKEAIQHAITAVLFHELAHALIDAYGLPIVGKEEDAADGLAVVALIRLYPKGRELAISAADLYEIESRDTTPEKEDYFDAHSLDIQRHYSMLCQVYGSDPGPYAWLAKKAGFTQDRREGCEEEFVILDDSWLALLEPFLKKGAPLLKQ
ncbi:DUF4344 domain-containing metallopeptidase [Roseateles oligotrophus]|nr:DUF4344 domain-containing metallopeptidase [Roseateles oligotrophus]